MTHSHKMMAYIQEMQHISRRAHIWKKTASMQEDGIYQKGGGEKSLSWGERVG
jgi:hypothetical protein